MINNPDILSFALIGALDMLKQKHETYKTNPTEENLTSYNKLKADCHLLRCLLDDCKNHK